MNRMSRSNGGKSPARTFDCWEPCYCRFLQIECTPGQQICTFIGRLWLNRSSSHRSIDHRTILEVDSYKVCRWVYVTFMVSYSGIMHGSISKCTYMAIYWGKCAGLLCLKFVYNGYADVAHLSDLDCLCLWKGTFLYLRSIAFLSRQKWTTTRRHPLTVYEIQYHLSRLLLYSK